MGGYLIKPIDMSEETKNKLRKQAIDLSLKKMKEVSMKNQAKLKALETVGGEVKYYYLRFGEVENGRPADGIATICLLKNGGLVHRGIAFCSPLDQFNKKLGRNLALGRAIKAMEKREHSDVISLSTPAGILRRQPGFYYLSTFNAYLTEYEKKLMGTYKKELVEDANVPAS